MNKKEFEEKLKEKLSEHYVLSLTENYKAKDLIQKKIILLAEQYAKQVRVDELWRMQNKLYGVTDMQGVKDEFENRIKELK